MRKGNLALLLVLVMVSGAIAGCTGGNGGGSSGTQGPSETTGSPPVPHGGSNEGTGSGVSTWQTPWDAYSPVRLGGSDYHITSVHYTYTAGYGGGSKYTFDVEKERGYALIHVYASENGAKKDLGAFKVFAYHGRLTPIDNGTMPAVEYWVFVKGRTKETDSYFLAPSLNFGALMGGNVVGMEIVSGSKRYFWSNPAAIGMYDKMPYQEGDLDGVFSSAESGLATIWMAVMSSGLWTGLENHDLTKPGRYDWSGMGVSYHYRIEPDGTAAFDGKSFRVADVEWSYTVMGVSATGKGKIAPTLPIPLKFEGTFASPSQGTKTWSRFELRDIRLSENFGSLSYHGLTPTATQSQGQSQTQTQTSAQGSGSTNWRLGWDASKPVVISGSRYLVKEVTFRVEYKKGDNVFRMNITKGYREARLNGKKVYLLYANVGIGGREYTFRVYIKPGYLNEYTSGILWVPQVYDMVGGPDVIKVDITGPGCHYSLGEDGSMEGDYNCGRISNDFQDYNMVWSFPTGFYGGLYGDVLTYVTLGGNGRGYTVEQDGSADLAGMKFGLYKVTWSGQVQNVGVQANGVTYVAPQLPFPVKVEAAISEPGGAGRYMKVELVGLKLERTDSGKT